MSQPPKLEVVVSLKVTPAQARAYKKAAKQRGLRLGQWVRGELDRAAAHAGTTNGASARLEAPRLT